MLQAGGSALPSGDPSVQGLNFLCQAQALAKLPLVPCAPSAAAAAHLWWVGSGVPGGSIQGPEHGAEVHTDAFLKTQPKSGGIKETRICIKDDAEGVKHSIGEVRRSWTAVK